jgi:hypothetical protein
MSLNWYLRWVNPVVAVLVLLICLYAATVDTGDFELSLIIDGSFPTYFVAKGIFCSVTLFLLGKIASGHGGK